MKHIKEAPAPLPADLPPNVRELIEITLVKNPGMRYRNGAAFADAVASVRSGRRPPRPNQAPTINRATPAAVPSGTQARMAADMSARSGAMTGTRPRTTTGTHRPPPPKRTFSSGQRALLWAAGVLGALAIVIAVLIVINARDRQDRQQQLPPTVRESVTTPASTAPPASPQNWTQPRAVGQGSGQIGYTVRFTPTALPAPDEN
jgi:serine/threonine-protein kinase